MAKVNGRGAKNAEYNESEFGSIVNKLLPSKFRLKCKNEAQKELSKLITNKEIIVAAGPAGTGKSYVSIARAIELLQNSSNSFQKIVISKPAVDAEEKLGFTPGTVREKLEPYLASSLDIVDKIMGKANRKKLEENDYLLIQALGFIRGKTLDNSIIIIEEAQNLSPNQCKTILSRIGYNSKLIISGDLDQSDRYVDVTKSGLYDLFMKHKNVTEVGFMEFQLSDIVRNPVISKLLDNYPKLAMPRLSDIKPNDDRVYPQPPTRPEVRVIPEGSVPKKVTYVIPVKNSDPSVIDRIKKKFSKKFTW